MLIFSILIQFLFLIQHSQCWFFDHVFFNDFSTKWFNYKKTFNKFYPTQQETILRRSIFKKNFDFIEKFNKRYSNGSSFTTGVNSFADMTSAEFLKKKTGLIVDQNSIKTVRPPSIRNKRDVEIPSFKDWRTNNKVSPIQDQGGCGSCYAFATIAAVESFKAIKYNYMPQYSVQELIDCSIPFAYSNNMNCNGCKGGSLSCGFQYVKYKGLSDNHNLLRSFPMSFRQSYTNYKGREGTCQKMDDHPLISDYAVYYQEATSDDIASWVYYFGPIAVGIQVPDSPSFQFYKSGIYDDPDCTGGPLNHAVLLVGYGSENGKDYWILKNSWGNWGENGYMRILRGKNLCNIELYGAFPFA